jgi:hypothetical protein
MTVGGSVVSPVPVSPPIAVPSGLLLVRIRAEFHEMPGLRLSLLQARRLFALDIVTCSGALATLQASGFLATTRDGAFVMAAADRMTA